MTGDEMKTEAETDTPGMVRLTDGLGPVVARWYCLSRDGMATLCKDQEDAQANARHCDMAWPAGGPYRAVMLGDVLAERERCARAAEGFEQTRDWAPTSFYATLRREVAALIRRGPNHQISGA